MTTKSVKNRPSNYFIATVRAFRKDGEAGGVELTKNGQPIAKCRASLSMGKNADGTYKPSMWLEIVGYTREGDDPNAVTEAVGELQTGDYVTVKGRLALDEWTDKEGAVRQNFTLWANSIEPFSFGDAQAPADEEEDVEEEEEEDSLL